VTIRARPEPKRKKTSRTPLRQLLREASCTETPPERLATLARSSHHSIRDAVARNPNTPATTLLKLWRGHGRSILEHNPILALWEFTGTTRTLSNQRLHALARLYIDLSNHSPGKTPLIISRETRLALIKAPDAPSTLAAALARDPDPVVRAAFITHLGKNPFHLHTPGSLLLNLARDPEQSVRLAFAEKIAAFGELPDTGILTRCALVLASTRDRKILSILRAIKNPPPLLALKISNSGADPLGENRTRASKKTRTPKRK
jgi:hypothetical protein